MWPTNTANIKGSPKPIAYHENSLISYRHGPLSIGQSTFVRN